MKFFEILKNSPSTLLRAGKKSKARLGILHTPHGDVMTPAFVPVATKGTLKSIPPKDLRDIGVQVAFVNTFHLTMHPGPKLIEKFGGIHEYSKLSIPLMSDSAGFQVFSLGRRSPEQSEGRRRLVPGDEREPLLLKVNGDGVLFRSPIDGKEIFFTPEFSIDAQEKIGADILMAFDECVYYGATKEYTKEATQRTHEWLVRCVEAKKRKGQFLYGIVQGGVFKDLRVASAKFVGKQNVSGIAIGGVSVGETKKEMKEQVGWCAPHLPPELPKHLLGIGSLEDIAEFVRLGIDTFDCVEPTRLARNGIVFQTLRLRSGQENLRRIDLTKVQYVKNKNPIQKDCACYACQNFSLSFLHHLFKERELLGYYLATYHNLFFYEQFFSAMRNSIEKGLV